ncbi:putative baseplate assembly protein [Kitasatospora sp. NPDC048239]|uniref:putative baseplate assembly protein n=1 Tax=Kitasatospora sp. NPDC048239 TaxID=3364046 RepID=UPI00371D9C4D
MTADLHAQAANTQTPHAQTPHDHDLYAADPGPSAAPGAAGLCCAADHRREQLVRRGLNGIDGIEVADPDPGDGTVALCVTLLGPVPADLTVHHLRIDTAPGARRLHVLGVRARPPHEEDEDGCLEVTLDRAGDATTYHLALVEPGPHGHPGRRPLHGFDLRHHRAPFGFCSGRPTATDCPPGPGCPPAAVPAPALDYLAKDYASFRRLILDRLGLLVPGLSERHIPDLGITLVELLAHTADLLSYHQDAVATEAYLGTARRRISVRRHARLVDYLLHEGCNARTFVHLAVHEEPSPPWRADEVALFTAFDGAPPPGHPLRWEELPPQALDGAHGFEPLTEDPHGVLPLFPAHNAIPFHDWGDGECSLSTGATSVTLTDAPEPRQLRLEPGDFLLLEEVLGPRTGRPGDADPTHRHVVRLTSVRRGYDPVCRTPVLTVGWGERDALPFPLCVSTLGPAPDCRPLGGVALARGNILPVDHGTRVEEWLGPVPGSQDPPRCEAECRPAEQAPAAGRFRPRLSRPHLTHAEPLPLPAGCEDGCEDGGDGCPPAAAELLHRDPHAASPAVRLTETVGQAVWLPAPDLLASAPDDRRFVAETDDERVSWLRFGDGRTGRRPDPGATFLARYRIGEGPVGNVGAETITHLALRPGVRGHDLVVRPRNPLPAVGGTPPEAPVQARPAIPQAFRALRERAVTAEDYAELARRTGGDRLQGAAADLVWTGSWYEADVALDPRVGGPPGGCGCASPGDRHPPGDRPPPGGNAPPGDGCRSGDCRGTDRTGREIAAALERARRIGHDLRVSPATPVPVELELVVCVEPFHVRAQVVQALREEFSAGVLPDGRPGWFHPDRWGFGEGVYVSRILAAAQAVPGVSAVEVTGLRRQGEPDQGALHQGVLPVGPREIVLLDGTRPRGGRITVTAAGGR